MNISITRNNDRNLPITVKKDGAVIDITGWKFFLTVKKNPEDTDEQAIISKTVETHDDAVNGSTHIAINAADTAEESVGYYKFDILAVDASSKRQSSKTGAFYIAQEISDGDE